MHERRSVDCTYNNILHFFGVTFISKQRNIIGKVSFRSSIQTIPGLHLTSWSSYSVNLLSRFSVNSSLPEIKNYFSLEKQYLYLANASSLSKKPPKTVAII